MSARILIVDDNLTNLRLAASVLELEGFEIVQALDASQAQERLAESLPDLILMDVALPGMDGLELTRRIKADPRLAGIPVVALTAFAMKGDEAKAREAGCVGYLTKPIDTREFARQVADFLAPARPAQRRLLIVDDNPVNLRLLRVQLESQGIEVLDAEHGVEALEVLARQEVDGVISDILMPRMDGYRLCLEVRQDPRTAALPFVLYTSTYNSPADRELAAAAGADGYIAKPAPVHELLAALDSAAGRNRAAARAPAEIEAPVLKQYSESLIRKLEEKSTQLGVAYEGLAQTEARLSGLVESALDAIIAIDDGQKIVLFNAAAERMFGCSRDSAMGRSLDQFLPPRFRARHGDQIRQFGENGIDSKRSGTRVVWAVRSSGEEFPVEASISRLGTSKGWLFTVFLRDVSERVRAEQALAASESKLRRSNRVLSVLSGINNLIVRCTDRDELLEDACRIAVNEGQFAKAWIGLLDGDGLRLAAASGGDDAFRAALDRFLDEGQRGALHRPWRESLLELRPVVVDELSDEPLALPEAAASGSRSLAALPLHFGRRVEGVLVLHASEPAFFDADEMRLLLELAGDIGFALEHLRRSDELRFLANRDPLTALPNRATFVERLAMRLRDGASEQGRAVVLIDLERFRHVNETWGRSVGDSVLQQVGKRLYAADSSAARIGADVFALDLPRSHSAADLVRRFEEVATRSLDAPLMAGDDTVRLGCRGGIAVHPADGADAESLVRNAEAALRQARTSARRCVFYAPELNARAAETIDTESRLRRAIDAVEFVLHYQPKVRMVDRRIVGVEALIRWQDPDRGLVPPGKFIPVLEACGLIGRVGAWALNRALIDQSEWRALGLAAPRVAVNVSPLQLRRDEFVDDVLSALAAEPEARLELELTESVVMEDVAHSIRALTRLRAAGISVAVDDFGTGYCSLAYIARLPVTSLKIDRSFIDGMTEGPEGLSIVSSIIAMAHALHLQVVAEGVETEEQARLLHLLGCDEAQGFLFSRPLPRDELTALMRRDVALPATAA